MREIWWNSENSLVKFWRKSIKFWREFSEILRIYWCNLEKNFGKKLRKFCGKLGGILRKIWSFGENFGKKFEEKCNELLRKIWWNFERKWMKFCRKFGDQENLMKFWEQFGKILRKVWWNFGKKINEILERIRWNF